MCTTTNLGEKKMKRMWINQPSTLQPLHHLHGTNVLAYMESKDIYRIYFLTGDIISMRVQAIPLSLGWR